MERVRIMRMLSCLIILTLFFIGCSEDKTPLESVSHEVGWATPESDVFHAQKVVLSGAVSCRSCHGNDVDSGKEDTFCQDCHQSHINATYPHRYDWNIIGDADNHANYLKRSTIEPNCISCHGGKESAIASPCSRCHTD